MLGSEGKTDEAQSAPDLLFVMVYPRSADHAEFILHPHDVIQFVNFLAHQIEIPVYQLYFLFANHEAGNNLFLLRAEELHLIRIDGKSGQGNDAFDGIELLGGKRFVAGNRQVIYIAGVHPAVALGQGLQGFIQGPAYEVGKHGRGRSAHGKSAVAGGDAAEQLRYLRAEAEGRRRKNFGDLLVSNSVEKILEVEVEQMKTPAVFEGIGDDVTAVELMGGADDEAVGRRRAVEIIDGLKVSVQAPLQLFKIGYRRFDFALPAIFLGNAESAVLRSVRQ